MSKQPTRKPPPERIDHTFKLAPQAETPEEYHLRMLEEHAHAEHAFQSEVTTRLRRVETRLVSGLEALGANMVDHSTGIKVFLPVEGESEVGVITITSLGTTVKDLLKALENESGTFDIVYNNKVKIQLTTGDKIL